MEPAPAAGHINANAKPAWVRLAVHLHAAATGRADQQTVLDAIAKATGAQSVELLSESTTGPWVVLIEPTPGQSTEQLLMRVQQVHNVKSAEIDVKVKHH